MTSRKTWAYAMGSSRFQRTKVVYSCKTSLVEGPLLPYCHYPSGKELANVMYLQFTNLI
ncbi:hypothetical protein C1645_877857 [Glomus cerebriforme]|uniref:Uncharacterized protein n=1 Tax=Glomus cerebriforme TaxID=658196 RepID=A0A397SPU8_9GLOM|nr:hypothetical protein C1645_877857 [Glomus cerebriforme]